MGILMPVFYINIYKNIVENTYWGDVNFRFNAHNGTFMRIGILGYFLSLITFGIYSFWARAEWSREKYGRTKLDAGDSGRIKIHPQVTGGLMAKWFFVSFFGVIFTLGLALPWVISYNMKEWSKVLKFSGKIDYSTIRSKETKGSAIGEEAAEALDIDIGDFL